MEVIDVDNESEMSSSRSSSSDTINCTASPLPSHTQNGKLSEVPDIEGESGDSRRDKILQLEKDLRFYSGASLSSLALRQSSPTDRYTRCSTRDVSSSFFSLRSTEAFKSQKRFRSTDLETRGIMEAETTSPFQRSKTEKASFIEESQYPSRAGSTSMLTDEQQHVLDVVVKEKRSVFITGGAGTGKSFLLQALIKVLPPYTTYVTATTGIAALQLRGSTVHSFAGCGWVHPGESRRKVYARLGLRAISKWRKCEVLVIDEISMLESSFFELLDFLARRTRRSLEPFGGIQLVLSGDFLQLPPVVSSSLPGSSSETNFCFLSRAWLRCNPQVCVLSKSFRQKNLAFFHLLHEVRRGQMSEKSISILKNKSAKILLQRHCPTEKVKKEVVDAHLPSEESGAPSSIEGSFSSSFENVNEEENHTFLRPKRVDVSCENERFYAALQTPEYFYGGFHEGEGKFPKVLPQLLRLRKGCRVMLNKNVNTTDGLVNGSCGVITGFFNFRGSPRRSVSDFFPHADAVKLCQAGSSEGGAGTQHFQLPIVAFELNENFGGEARRIKEVIIEPNEWEETLGSKVISRTVQLPLVVAYAITVHKSQGMSLSLVDIDLSRAFEVGQAYVALSRCIDLEGVRIHNFDPEVVLTSEAALSYYEAIEFFAFQARKKKALAYCFGPAFSTSVDDHINCCSGIRNSIDGVRSSLLTTERDRDLLSPMGSAFSEEKEVLPLPPSGYVCPLDIVEEDDEESEEEVIEAKAWNGSRCSGKGIVGSSSRSVLHNASVTLEKWRCRLHYLLPLSARLNSFVQRCVIPFEQVRNKRIVLDIESCYHFFCRDCVFCRKDKLLPYTEAQSENMMHISSRSVGNSSFLWNSFSSLSSVKHKECSFGSPPFSNDTSRNLLVDNVEPCTLTIKKEEDHKEAEGALSSQLYNFSHECCVERGNMLRIPRVVADFFNPSFSVSTGRRSSSSFSSSLCGLQSEHKNENHTQSKKSWEGSTPAVESMTAVAPRSSFDSANCIHAPPSSSSGSQYYSQERGEDALKSPPPLGSHFVKEAPWSARSGEERTEKEDSFISLTPTPLLHWITHLQKKMDLDVQRCPSESWQSSLLFSSGGVLPAAWELYRPFLSCLSPPSIDFFSFSSTDCFPCSSSTTGSLNGGGGRTFPSGGSATTTAGVSSPITLPPSPHLLSSSTSYSPRAEIATTSLTAEEGIPTDIDQIFTEYCLHNGPPMTTSFSHSDILRYALYLQQKEEEAKTARSAFQGGEKYLHGNEEEGSVILCTSSVTLLAAALAVKLKVTSLPP